MQSNEIGSLHAHHPYNCFFNLLYLETSFFSFVREKLYSGNHSDIAQSLNDLTVSYDRFEYYKKAFEYYKIAFEYHNKAFEYYNKSLEMLEKINSGNHPQLCKSYDFLDFRQNFHIIYKDTHIKCINQINILRSYNGCKFY